MTSSKSDLRLLKREVLENNKERWIECTDEYDIKKKVDTDRALKFANSLGFNVREKSLETGLGEEYDAIDAIEKSEVDSIEEKIHKKLEVEMESLEDKRYLYIEDEVILGYCETLEDAMNLARERMETEKKGVDRTYHLREGYDEEERVHILELTYVYNLYVVKYDVKVLTIKIKPLSRLE